MMEVTSKFSLGRLVATPNAINALTHDDTLNAINRHRSGDWGDVCEEDRQANDRALLEGTRMLSAYHSVKGVKFWIVTEVDRSATTVLLPEDY